MRHTISTIVDEERALLREGLIALLHDSAYKVVRRVANATQLAEGELPADLCMLTIFGISQDLERVAEKVRLCRINGPQRKIAVIGELNPPVDLQRILSIGADAWIFNVSSRNVLIKALDLAFLDQQIVVWDRKFITLGKDEHTSMDSDSRSNGRPPRPDKAEHVAIESNVRTVSRREKQILSCLIRGDSNKMIARWCGISEATVKVHLKTILRKIDAQNRTQAAVWALENGLVVGDLAEAVDDASVNDTSIVPS